MKDFEIRCDESRLETTNLIYGKFTLGPFLPGQATTFGNALRRSLLAELSGLAITAFEIIGVMQEFSTLPGLRESILDLSLNLKQIVLTGVLPHSTPPIGFLNVRGPAIIKAIDLKLPAGVYCASPNQYIATLGSNGMLHLKFVVSVGKGYSIQPYSIYRSLSKVKLQPASNFDNTTLGAKQRSGINYARQVPLGYESFKDVNLSATPVPLESKGYNKETSSFVKPLRFAHSKELYMQSKEGPLSLRGQEQRSAKLRFEDQENLGEDCKASLCAQKGKINFSASSDRANSNPLDKFANQKTKKEESSSTVKSKEENLEKGFSYNVEHVGRERTDFSPSDASIKQTFNSKSVITSRNSKTLEDPLISFAHNVPTYVQNKATDSVALRDRIKGTQNKEGLVKPRDAKQSVAGQEQTLSYKTSQSTLFTNEKNLTSSYINIQTQLFQRITPHQVLPIDAVFTPVSQVNFLTEVNDRFETARENIVLEIWTNGSIHPKRALEEATLSLVQNFDTLLKKIQQASSFYKGLRYWTYLQPFKSSLGEKTDGFFVNSLSLPPDVENKATDFVEVKTQKGLLDNSDKYKSKICKKMCTICNSPSLVTMHDIEDVSKKGYAKQHTYPFGVGQNKEGVLPLRGQEQLLRQQEDDLLRPHKDYLEEEQGDQKRAEESAGYTEQRNVCKTADCKALLTSKGCGSESEEKNLLEEEPPLSQQEDYLLQPQEELLKKLFKKDLPQSIYNLDIGNLNLSLQTFIFLKKAKIHTLLQLLTQFYLKQNNIRNLESNFLNEKIVGELNSVIRQFGSKD